MTTVSYKGATLELTRATVRTRLQANFLYSQLGVSKDTPTDEFHLIMSYVRFLTQAKVVKGTLDFELPDTHAGEAALQQGYEAFLDADETFYDQVIVPLNTLDYDLTDAELAPVAEKNA